MTDEREEEEEKREREREREREKRERERSARERERESSSSSSSMEKENVIPVGAYVAAQAQGPSSSSSKLGLHKLVASNSGGGGILNGILTPSSVGTKARMKQLLHGTPSSSATHQQQQQLQTNPRTPLLARTPLGDLKQQVSVTPKRFGAKGNVGNGNGIVSSSATCQHSAVAGYSNLNSNPRKNTWNGDVDIYSESRAAELEESFRAGVVSQEGKERGKRNLALGVQRVKQDQTSAAAWWDFLRAEEENKSSSNVYKLYEWATKLVPRKGNKDNESYINLWLGYIKRQKNEEDIRDTFKTLRNMGIGEKCALLYQRWALFEVAAGNTDKARGIVKKGVKAGALEKGEMEAFESKCLAGSSTSQPSAKGHLPLMNKRAAEQISRAPAAHTSSESILHMQQRQQPTRVMQPERMLGSAQYAGKADEEDTPSRTESSVLAPKTFCSSIYSNSATLNMSGTAFTNDHGTSLSSSKPLHAYTPSRSSHLNLTNASSTLRDAKAVETLATPKSVEIVKAAVATGESGTPGRGGADQSMKGPKRLGLKRFAGPARRIKPAEGSAKMQPSVNSESDRRHVFSVPTVSNPVTENYTDLSGKLSPIVELSCSTNSSSRTSTRTASSCQTDDIASRRTTPNMSSSDTEKHSTSLSKQPESNLKTDAQNAAPNPVKESIASRQQAQATESNDAKVAQKVDARPAAVASTSQQVRESSNSVTVHNVKYTVLECVGKGGSSKVYKVISPEHKIYALKRIKLEGREKEAAAGFMDEITLLNRFKGRHHIIQLVDSQILKDYGLIYMVLEYGEVDLARLLQRRERARTAEGQNKIDLNFIRLHWQQMLEAVHIIHEERIVHSDLKPANFLFVEGVLKLIDFGIAKAIQNDTTHIARESQVGTLNYMSPEAILSGSNGSRAGKQMKVGRASDVWSLGCILYQMVYGHTPFSHLQFIQKLHAITDPNHQIEFPSIQNQSLLDVMKRCLDRNPKTRIGIPELLEHMFLNPSQGNMAPSNLLTPEFLNSMLMQLSSMHGGQSSADISKLSQELCKQLAAGTVPDLKSLMPSAPKPVAGGAPLAPPPPPPPMPPLFAPQNKMKMIMDDIKKKKQLRPTQKSETRKPQPMLQHGANLAAAVAAKALARSKQRQEALVALEKKEDFFNDGLKDALQKQHAALRPVEKENTNADNLVDKEPDNLEGVLLHGLNKKFQNVLHNNLDETMTGDITGSTATSNDMSWQ